MVGLNLNYKGALGDILCLSSAIYDFKTANPDIALAVNCPFAVVLSGYGLSYTKENYGNLYITDEQYKAAVLAAQTKPKHVIEFFHNVLEQISGRPCPVVSQAPVIVPRLLPPAPVDGTYWVLFAGGKSDIPLKMWNGDYYQAVVDYLISRNIKVVQTGRVGDRHYALQNTIKFFDPVSNDNNLRRLFSLIRHSAGVICPITSGMHLAAAFNKPCVVIAGGREDPWWEAYNGDYGAFNGQYAGVPHRYLQTVGRDPELACCYLSGCWNRTFGDGQCEQFNVLVDFPNRLAKCMMTISPEQVIQAVESYL